MHIYMHLFASSVGDVKALEQKYFHEKIQLACSTNSPLILFQLTSVKWVSRTTMWSFGAPLETS